MQKTTEDEEGVFLSGFPIKDFGNDGGGGFLNVYMRNLNNGRGHPYGSKKKKHGCPIEDFRHDKKYYKGALPPYKPPKEKNKKTK